MNQEEIYKLLQENKHKILIDYLFSNRDEIKSDPLLKHASNIVFNTIIQIPWENYVTDYDLIESLEKIYLIFSGKHYNFDQIIIDELLTNIINIKLDKSDVKSAKSYCSFNNKLEICKDDRITTTIELNHNMEEFIDVKIVNSKRPNSSISLFKSIEEEKMFLAFKRVFDTYQVYPNVAISNIIDKDSIFSELNDAEKRFFYTGSVDLVIFEPFEFYKPKYFFELDSIWHDSDGAKNRDAIKDKIFKLAGLKLVRIRDKQNQKISEIEFKELVLQIRDKI